MTDTHTSSEPLGHALHVVVRDLQSVPLSAARVLGHARMLFAAADALAIVMPNGFFDTEPAQTDVLMRSSAEATRAGTGA